MIEYKQGNILESTCEVLVNTINTKGVMGKGLALQFKNKYPEMFEDYKKNCQDGKVAIGKLHIWKEKDKYIVNFPTKDHWRYPSKIEYIEKGLIALAKWIKENKIKSIAVPSLGTGLGGLPFNLVKNKILEVHDQHWTQIEVELYEPIK